MLSIQLLLVISISVIQSGADNKIIFHLHLRERELNTLIVRIIILHTCPVIANLNYFLFINFDENALSKFCMSNSTHPWKVYIDSRITIHSFTLFACRLDLCRFYLYRRPSVVKCPLGTLTQRAFQINKTYTTLTQLSFGLRPAQSRRTIRSGDKIKNIGVTE